MSWSAIISGKKMFSLSKMLKSLNEVTVSFYHIHSSDLVYIHSPHVIFQKNKEEICNFIFILFLTLEKYIYRKMEAFFTIKIAITITRKITYHMPGTILSVLHVFSFNLYVISITIYFTYKVLEHKD